MKVASTPARVRANAGSNPRMKTKSARGFVQVFTSRGEVPVHATLVTLANESNLAVVARRRDRDFGVQRFSANRVESDRTHAADD